MYFFHTKTNMPGLYIRTLIVRNKQLIQYYHEMIDDIRNKPYFETSVRKKGIYLSEPGR